MFKWSICVVLVAIVLNTTPSFAAPKWSKREVSGSEESVEFLKKDIENVEIAVKVITSLLRKEPELYETELKPDLDMSLEEFITTFEEAAKESPEDAIPVIKAILGDDWNE